MVVDLATMAMSMEEVVALDLTILDIDVSGGDNRCSLSRDLPMSIVGTI